MTIFGIGITELNIDPEVFKRPKSPIWKRTPIVGAGLLGLPKKDPDFKRDLGLCSPLLSE